jgi:tetratricopeptide (TPR) repeat protein
MWATVGLRSALTGGSKPFRSSSNVLEVRIGSNRNNNRQSNTAPFKRRYTSVPSPKLTPTLINSFLLTCLLLVVLGANGLAQTTAAGQANSREEFDEYLLILSKTAPKEVLSAAGSFERHWPGSKLVAHVLELELEAYRSLGDSANAILAGEKALKAAPDNLFVLTNIAYILASSTSDQQQLARAERYARRELELSTNIRIPKRISPREWEEIQGRQNSTAHATLGLVAYKRGNTAGAIHEFETAVKLAPVPEAAHYYRLGMLYRASGNESRAIEMLRRAVESNDPTIRRLAESELKTHPGRRQTN